MPVPQLLQQPCCYGVVWPTYAGPSTRGATVLGHVSKWLCMEMWFCMQAIRWPSVTNELLVFCLWLSDPISLVPVCLIGFCTLLCVSVPIRSQPCVLICVAGVLLETVSCSLIHSVSYTCPVYADNMRWKLFAHLLVHSAVCMHSKHAPLRLTPPLK